MVALDYCNIWEPHERHSETRYKLSSRPFSTACSMSGLVNTSSIATMGRDDVMVHRRQGRSQECCVAAHLRFQRLSGAAPRAPSYKKQVV